MKKGKKKGKPANGKFTGRVGNNAIIAFKTSGRNVMRLSAGVQATCQRASNGEIRGPVFLAVTPTGKLKIDKKGRFSGGGQENDTGVAWEISGKFKSRTLAKGTFEASQFNFFPGFFFDSELCAGSGEWTAKLKQSNKKKKG